MGEFRIYNATLDHFFTRSSPQEISPGSNASTHFYVETPSMQNVGILLLLTSLITFRHFYNKGREDVLKSFTPSFIKSAMPFPAYCAHLLLQVVWMKKAELEFCFFPFGWDKRFLKPKSTAYCAWKVVQKRLPLKPKCSIRHSRPWRLTQPSQYKLWRQRLCFSLVCVLSL